MICEACFAICSLRFPFVARASFFSCNFFTQLRNFFFFFFSVKRLEFDLFRFRVSKVEVAYRGDNDPFLFGGDARDCICLQPSGNRTSLVRFENERSVRTGGSKGFDTVERLITISRYLDVTREKLRVIFFHQRFISACSSSTSSVATYTGS